jgi:hypothetical protein
MEHVRRLESLGIVDEEAEAEGEWVDMDDVSVGPADLGTVGFDAASLLAPFHYLMRLRVEAGRDVIESIHADRFRQTGIPRVLGYRRRKMRQQGPSEVVVGAIDVPGELARCRRLVEVQCRAQMAYVAEQKRLRVEQERARVEREAVMAFLLGPEQGVARVQVSKARVLELSAD